MMSISMDKRLLVLRCSISELPPLNRKGQPERASASSNENALMVFSINALSRIPIFWDASVIHSMDLLLELIIVYGVYYLFDFGLAISARGIS